MGFSFMGSDSSSSDLFGWGQAGHDFTTQWVKPAIDWYWSKKAAKWQMQLEKQMMNYSYQLQNKWNSPAAQMARYRAAKLNPNLIYGSVGNMYTAATGHAPNVSVPEFQPPELGGIISSYLDNKIKRQQVSNAETSGKLLGAQVKKTEEQTKELKLRNAEAEETGTTDRGATSRILGGIKKLAKKVFNTVHDATVVPYEEVSLDDVQRKPDDVYIPSDVHSRATRTDPESVSGRNGLTRIGESVEGGQRLRKGNTEVSDLHVLSDGVVPLRGDDNRRANRDFYKEIRRQHGRETARRLRKQASANKFRQNQMWRDFVSGYD